MKARVYQQIDFRMKKFGFSYDWEDQSGYSWPQAFVFRMSFSLDYRRDEAGQIWARDKVVRFL